jgi:cell division initiation protein
MKLTPLDIRHKEFKRGMRGYADEEVDEFLDEVADEFERVFKENIDLNERIEALEEKVAHYRTIEETLQKTLLNAQQAAEEMKQNATKESQLILRDAELKARAMVNDSYADKQEIEKTVVVLRNAEQDFRFKFRALLQGYLKQLDEAEGAKAGEAAADFARQAEAIKDAISREVPVVAGDTPEEDTMTPVAAPAEPAASTLPPIPAPDAVTVPEPAPSETLEPPVPAPAPETAVHAAPAWPEPAPEEAHAGAPGIPTADVPAPEAPFAAPAAPGEDPLRDDSHVLFGEDEDALSDVDTDISDSEFKW